MPPTIADVRNMEMADFHFIFDGRDTFMVEIISRRAPLANSRLFDRSGRPGLDSRSTARERQGRTKNRTAATSRLEWRGGIAGAGCIRTI
jgi:hypothetical protein